MLETTKLVIAFKLMPIDPPAVRAGLGRTSERTTQVTGPVPSPKANIKAMRQVDARPGRSAFRPIARPVREMVSASLQNVRRFREPVRWGISLERLQRWWKLSASAT